jgi:hypothetical protein
MVAVLFQCPPSILNWVPSSSDPRMVLLFVGSNPTISNAYFVVLIFSYCSKTCDIKFASALLLQIVGSSRQFNGLGDLFDLLLIVS